MKTTSTRSKGHQLGVPHSFETKQKIGDALKSYLASNPRVYDEERKRKISEGMRKWHAARAANK